MHIYGVQEPGSTALGPSSRIVGFVDEELDGAGLAHFATQSWITQHAGHFGSARAVHNLFAQDTATSSESRTIDLPAVSGGFDGLREFVIGDLDAGQLTFFLSQ